MIYNRLKRILEKTAGIVGLIYSILTLGGALFLSIWGIIIIVALAAAGHVGASVMYLIFGLILLGIAICSIIFDAKIIKSPLRPEGVLRTNKIRVCAIVFSFLCGNFATFGIEIAVMIMKDFVPVSSQPQNLLYSNQFYAQPMPQPMPQPMQQPMPQPTQQPIQQTFSQPAPQSNELSIDQKIAELKKLQDLGVIDDETFKKAIDKIISDIATR